MADGTAEMRQDQVVPHSGITYPLRVARGAIKGVNRGVTFERSLGLLTKNRCLGKAKRQGRDYFQQPRKEMKFLN